MPAILESDAFDAWLDPDAERPVLDGLLLPAAGATLARVAVDRGVGNVANDGPKLIDEAAADREEPATLF